MKELLLIGVVTLILLIVFWSHRRCKYTWTREIPWRDDDGRPYQRQVLHQCSFRRNHEGPHGSNLGPAPAPRTGLGADLTQRNTDRCDERNYL